MRRWARGLGLFAALDADGFLALSITPGAARRLLRLDAAPGDRIQAVGIEQTSRIYLNHAAALIRQAQRYASRSHATYVLPGFDYQKFMQEVDTVGDGVETFLHPRPGDPGPVVPV